MTVQEAARYLSVSEESIERRFASPGHWFNGEFKLPNFEPGKIRFRRIGNWNAVSKSERKRATPIRLLGVDVYELLPLPDGFEEMQTEGWQG